MNRPDPMAALPPNLITVDDVAARTSLSRMTIYRLIHSERLRAYRIGRSFRIDPRDVVSLVRDGNTITWELHGGGQA